MRNDGANAGGGAALVVTLTDSLSPNRRGIGAELTLETNRGSHTRWIFSGGSYLSACALEAHFGLGSGEQAQALTVQWPDGATQRTDVSGSGTRVSVERKR